MAELARDTGPHDHDTRLRRIARWVADHLRFLPDPAGIEAVTTPAAHIRRIVQSGESVGDCDDAAALAGALAGAVGRRVRLHVVSYRLDRRFHHVFAVAEGSRGWIDLDPFRSERFRPTPTRQEIVTV